MRWTKEYQLFLFDFDGLLVNTEELHFEAYRRMCAKRGVHLDWDFDRFCSIAHYSADGLRQHILAQFPQLKAPWDILYAEKKRAFIELVDEGAVSLMPGAKEVLECLEQAKVKRCVVTHSAIELVSSIRSQHPILDTIPIWFTREHYTKPKPDPECYIKAIETFAEPGEKVIGFEDSPRGMEALFGSRAQPVWIAEQKYPEIGSFVERGALHFSSLLTLMTKF